MDGAKKNSSEVEMNHEVERTLELLFTGTEALQEQVRLIEERFASVISPTPPEAECKNENRSGECDLTMQLNKLFHSNSLLLDRMKDLIDRCRL